jgi:hypothetical protein
MKHRVDRHVSDEEKRLWMEFRTQLDSSEFEHISVTEVAVERVGIHQTRSRQIVSTWENEGLAVSGGRSGSYDAALLRERGRHVDAIESTMTDGDSWR